MIKVKCNDDGRIRELDTLPVKLSKSGYLAVTRQITFDYTENPGVYVITHVPSGQTLTSRTWANRDAAVWVMNEIDSPEWNFPNFTGTQEQESLRFRFVAAVEKSWKEVYEHPTRS